METALAVAPEIGMAPACRALGVSRATAYRHRDPKPRAQRPPRPKSPLALSGEERSAVLAQLHSERFTDDSPAQVYASLLDEGTYLASERTMYRLLAAAGESRERRAQLRHPIYVKPELLATGPNQLWSWDITKLKGPVKWTCYHLYVLLDVFSRYVPGWLLAHHESGTLADRLIDETVAKEGITSGLKIHADRGPAMTSKPVASARARSMVQVANGASCVVVASSSPSGAKIQPPPPKPPPDRFDERLKAPDVTAATRPAASHLSSESSPVARGVAMTWAPSWPSWLAHSIRQISVHVSTPTLAPATVRTSGGS